MNSVVKENKCEVFTVRFSGFEGLPARKGRDKVHSPHFTCFGHRWRVRLYPGGIRGSEEGYASVFLENCSPGSIDVQATFTAAESKPKIAAAYAFVGSETYEAVGEIGKNNWGRPNFAQRSTIIGALENGELIIEVKMRQTGPSTLPPPPFVPTNPASANTLKKFRDEESSDVIFEVSSDEVEEGERMEEGGRKSRKRTKISPTTFHAHRFVLLDNAPALAEACESSSGLSPIPITGVNPEIFHYVLYYLYGGVVDNGVLKEKAKAIIDAADKFGVVGLKLEAEASLVGATTFTIDNVMDNLLYADAKNCPLLKEAVMDFLVENGDAADQLSFDNLPSGLMKDLLIAMNSRDKRRDSGGEKGDEPQADRCHDRDARVCDFRNMRVSELRRELHEKVLGVDGSREAMIAALEGWVVSSASDEEEG